MPGLCDWERGSGSRAGQGRVCAARKCTRMPALSVSSGGPRRAPSPALQRPCLTGLPPGPAARSASPQLVGAARPSGASFAWEGAGTTTGRPGTAGRGTALGRLRASGRGRAGRGVRQWGRQERRRAALGGYDAVSPARLGERRAGGRGPPERSGGAKGRRERG